MDRDVKLHPKAAASLNERNCSGNYSSDEAHSIHFCLTELKTRKLKLICESEIPQIGSSIPDFELIFSRNLVVMVSVTRAIHVVWDTKSQKHYNCFTKERSAQLMRKKITGLFNALYNKDYILSSEFSQWGKSSRKCKVMGVLHILCPNDNSALLCRDELCKLFTSSYLLSKNVSVLFSIAKNPVIYPSVIRKQLFS